MPVRIADASGIWKHLHYPEGISPFRMCISLLQVHHVKMHLWQCCANASLGENGMDGYNVYSR